jgi:hypothetical protein
MTSSYFWNKKVCSAVFSPELPLEEMGMSDDQSLRNVRRIGRQNIADRRGFT